MRAGRVLLLFLFWTMGSPAWTADFSAVDQKLNAGDYEAALKELKGFPTDTRADLYGVLLRQAEIALGVGKAALAEELFEKASFQVPTATEAQAGLTRALMAQGRFKEAQAEVRRALKEAPGDVMLSIAVAQLENRMGQVDAALARLEKARAGLAPHAVAEAQALLIAQAEVLMERSRANEARQRLKDWLAQHPNDAAALDWLGQAEYALGNHGEGGRLRALAAMRYHTEGQLAKATSIAEWVAAQRLLHPGPPAWTQEPSKPEKTKPETVALPSPRLERAETPPPTFAPPAVAQKPAPRPLPEARFEPIHVPKGMAISTGSGFIIDGGERVVTNAHVVGDARQLIVRNGIGQVRKARVEVISKEDDLAILRLDAPYPSHWAIPRERIEEPRPGRSCYVLGYPLAGTLGSTWPALTSGLVSRTDGGKGGMMQITAALNSGNSGGPVVDDQGRLIGIVVAKLDTLKYAEKHGQIPEDVNFAIRPSLLIRLLSGLQQKVSEISHGFDQMDAESIYELMLPSVVLVVAPREIK